MYNKFVTLSLKNLGNILNTFGASLGNFKELKSILNALGGSSLSNIDKITTVLKDLSSTGDRTVGESAIKQLLSIMNTFDGSATSINDVAKALDGLSNKSKAAVLSIFNLNEAQAEAILINAGLSGEELKTAVATVTAGNAATGASFGFTAFAISVKEAAAGIATFLLTNPVGWAILAAGAIFGAVKAYDALTVSTSEAIENARESKAALAETNSEIESLYNQKQSNLSRIAELEKDQTGNTDEIDRLRDENDLLEAQINLKEKIAERDRKTAAEDAYKALTTEQKEIVDFVDNGGAYSAVYETSTILDRAKADRKSLEGSKKSYSELIDEINQIEEANDFDPDDSIYKSKVKQAEVLNKSIADLEANLAADELTILELYQSLLNPDRTAMAGYETLVGDIQELFPEISKGASSMLSENMKLVSDAYKNSVGSDIPESVRENLTNTFDNWLLSLSETDQQIVYDLSCNTDTAQYSLEEWQAKLAETKSKVESLSSVPIDISAETSGIESVTSAISESNSATGLSADRISELTSRYKELDGFDANRLFANTATGVKVNTRELNNLEKQYESLTKQKLQDTLKGLISEYEDLTKKIEEYSGISETAVKDLKAQRDAKEDEIDSIKALAAQYNGLTSAYNEWINAQNATQSGSWYDSAKEGLESLKALYESGEYGNTALQEGLEYFTGIDIVDIDNWQKRMEAMDEAYAQLGATIDGTTYSINDFMVGGQEGCNAFLSAIQQVNEDWAKFDAATGAWELNYDISELAAEFGTSVEFIEMMQDKLEQYGFQFDDVESRIEDITNAVKDASSAPLALDTPEEQLEATKQIIDDVKSSDATPDTKTERLEELYALVDDLVTLANQPTFMEIDTSSVETSLQEPLNLLKEYQTSVNSLDALKIKGADTSEIDAASAKVADLANRLAELDATTLSNLGFNLDGINFDNLAAELEAQIPTLEVPVTAFATSGGDSKTEDSTALVNYELGEQAQPNDMSALVNYELGNVAKPQDVTVKVNYELGNVAKPTTVGGQSQASGTAHSIGSAFASGTAKMRGDIGTTQGGKTLMGELGSELYVDPNTNRWQTVGDNGAEFVNLPRGAIVFNHLQTKSLLNQGHVSGRGKALVSGNAAAMLNSKPIGATSPKNGSTTNGTGMLSTGSSSKNNRKGKTSDSSKTDEDAKKSIDWIEVAISRIERVINRLKETATSTYKALKTKLGATYDEIVKVNEELSLQQKAYDRYMQEANSVGLSSDLVSLVQNGAIDVSEYDEDTQKLIAEYQDFYEKALECSDAVESLNESLAELYENRFNDIQNDFDNQVELLDHLTNTYESGIDALEARGYLESTKYYSELQNVEERRISVLSNQLSELEKSFSEAMNSGQIEQYSDSWYSMQTAINDVKEQIDEANNSLFEYAQTMREIEWDHFDYAQERISKLTSESDFMIGLMSNGKMHNDTGKLTDEGLATVGLHGQNYNVYMAQADMYAKEIKKINKDLANDPSNTTLIERREELLELQQDSIMAAEDEKNAIVDLVQDGINLELESVQKLIDTYSDALNNAKDLYDYQKKIASHTDEIATLRKQLSAYSNDNSEETKAIVQKIKVELKNAESDLEETEYERYVSDQQKMLDELYLEFETVMNQRLDNVEALFEEMIGMVNLNSDMINSTLIEVGSDVGYTMTDNMQSIWSDSAASIEGIMSVYGDGFNEKLTSINEVLSQIHVGISDLVEISNVEAEKVVENTEKQTTVDKNAVVSIPKTTTQSGTKTGSSSTNKSASSGKSGSTKKPSAQPKTTHVHDYSYSTKVVDPTASSQGYTEHRCSCGAWKRDTFKSKLPLSALDRDVLKFASGGLADYTGYAWIDGSKSRPEMVLDAKDTENFIELKNVLRSMMNQELSISNYGGYIVDSITHSVGAIDISSILSSVGEKHEGGSTSFGDINITIPIDHVDNYNDFVNQLRSDKKFEQMIQTITVDRLNRKSSLAKNKYSW